MTRIQNKIPVGSGIADYLENNQNQYAALGLKLENIHLNTDEDYIYTKHSLQQEDPQATNPVGFIFLIMEQMAHTAGLLFSEANSLELKNVDTTHETQQPQKDIAYRIEADKIHVEDAQVRIAVQIVQECTFPQENKLIAQSIFTFRQN